MTGFLSVSLCRGSRPRRYSSAHIEARPNLVSRLASARLSARFLVAPSGYGKTYLALEYAQEEFGFEHVVWLDAQDSRFCTEVRRGELACSLFAVDSALQLVVIDGIPFLDDETADELSHCIDQLLEKGCEVLAACTPGCDVFAQRQIGRALLQGVDLLIESKGRDGSLQGRPLSLDRIPCVAWGGSAAASRFALRCAKEPMPAALVCLTLYLLVVEKGKTDDLSYLLPGVDVHAALLSLSVYPHLGINLSEGVFFAVGLDLALVENAFRPAFDKILAAADMPDLDDLARFLAEKSRESEGIGRACDVIRVFGSNSLKASWANDHGETLLRKMRLASLCQLLQSMRLDVRVDARLAAILSLAWVALGEDGKARDLALALSGAKTRDRHALLCSLFLLSRLGKDADCQMAYEKATALTETGGLDAPELLLASLTVGGPCVLDALEAYAAVGRDAGMAAIATCCAFEEFPRQLSPCLESFVTQLGQVDDLGLAGFMAVKTAQRAVGDGTMGEEAVSSGLALKMFRAEADLRRQQALVRLWEETGSHADGDFADPASLNPAVLGVPVLEIKLFGCLDVRIDGSPVPRSRLNRTNSRALLALLALEPGREFSRERLALQFWPGSSKDNALKNCYTIWSSLKKALELPDGSCPYLTVLNHGYMLEGAYVRVDADRVREICDAFRLGPVHELTWQQQLSELERITRGGLVPGEGEARLIVEARQAMDRKIKDSLVVASKRLLEQGHAMAALAFARAAQQGGTMREDVCLALMSAQVACGQREDAIRVFLDMRRHLDQTVGIEPSAPLIRLYMSILEDDGSI